MEPTVIVILIGAGIPVDPLEISVPLVPELATRQEQMRKPWWGKDDGRYITWPAGDSHRG